MKNNIPCEIIRELFPSYIEGLTSEKVNEYVEEHVEECDECRKVLAVMREPVENDNAYSADNNEEKKEIDFLKKTRRGYNKKIIISIFALAAVLISVFCARVFFVGKTVGAEFINYNLSVVKNAIVFEGTTYDSKIGVKNVEFEQDGDTVKINVKSVRKSFIYSDFFQESFEADEDIKKVIINDRIVWANGAEISTITDELFKVRNEYIGDHSADGEILRVFQLQRKYGDYEVELKTKEQPYELKVKFLTVNLGMHKKNMDDYLKKYAYIMLAEIKNMDIMTFEYELDESNMKNVTVTKEEASQYFDKDIKEAGEKIEVLQELIEKTGLEKMKLATGEENETDDDVIRINILNLSDKPIYGFGISKYNGDDITSSGGMVNADGSAISKNEITTFEVSKSEFDVLEWDDLQGAKISVAVTDKNNKEHDAGAIELDSVKDKVLTVIIKSDNDGNYYMEKE
ncbi:MAG: DUF4825 domain-containing protein [Lachnospiraceae bacterium]|nr:DUF4825 domain-containing protein [Lachnospiraceae bacterium]